MSDASRVLVLGIGGGGDAVGSIAVAHALEARGLETVLGGVAWERFPVDPFPGPRGLSDIRGTRPLGTGAALIDPARGATTPEGAHFCESRLATYLGTHTVLVDVTNGPGGAAQGITAACAELGCDLVVLTDIGGDAIAEGGEPGLASPLCDAVMIAAGPRVREPCLLAVLGTGCDGELTPAEVLGRVASLACAGAWLDTLGVSAGAADEIEAAAAVAITEASLLVARAARGESGPIEIRGGRRTVELGPVAALAFVFDLEAAWAELPLAQAVSEAPTIEAARDALNARGISTELDYEERRATEGTRD
ncbi:MAG: DUF1152 domain-containing protein [Actinomycetota bacterium]|nr:DUF1152 domain-containing protein [Actinomycetota bacterium]